MERLLGDIEKVTGTDPLEAYSGAGTPNILEFTTREFFIDGVLKALGWTFGSSGTVAQEARIKVDTTNFMDYIGITEIERNPILMVEAKAWDVPFITSRNKNENETESNLIVRSINHIKNKGAEVDSPTFATWHGFLGQVMRYVRALKTNHNHDIQRAVLTSGQWLVVFHNPSETFSENDTANDEQIAIFHRSQFVERSTEILDLLGYESLASRPPKLLRPAQLPQHIQVHKIKAVFHGVHVRYESSGSKKFVLSPRILVYPSLIILRDDNVLLTIMHHTDCLIVDYQEDSPKKLADHLEEMRIRAVDLLNQCSTETGVVLEPAPLAACPGYKPRTSAFSRKQIEPLYIEVDEVNPDHWMLITGQATHYLITTPVVDPCRFHQWRACDAAGYPSGNTQLSTRSIHKPRALFVDGQAHHCAHQLVLDRRDDRCQIAPIDSRVCCQACTFLEVCWPKTDRAALPCGQ
ncbi:MAG: hypothetical protein ACREPB_07835 [Arenimonas sp.]